MAVPAAERLLEPARGGLDLANAPLHRRPHQPSEDRVRDQRAAERRVSRGRPGDAVDRLPRRSDSDRQVRNGCRGLGAAGRCARSYTASAGIGSPIVVATFASSRRIPNAYSVLYEPHWRAGTHPQRRRGTTRFRRCRSRGHDRAGASRPKTPSGRARRGCGLGTAGHLGTESPPRRRRTTVPTGQLVVRSTPYGRRRWGLTARRQSEPMTSRRAEGRSG